MVLVFLLTTESGERLGYSLTIFLSFTVVLTITSDLMPTTSKELPIIGKPCIDDLTQVLTLLNLFNDFKKCQETHVHMCGFRKSVRVGVRMGVPDNGCLSLLF